jgi:RNA polymerase sigma-70 factor (ECF subfamily)
VSPAAGFGNNGKAMFKRDRLRTVEAAFRDNELSLRAFLRRFLSRPEDVDDALHEAFLRAYRRERAKPIEKPKAFLFKTARNVALNEIEKTRHRKTHTLGDFDVSAVKTIEDTPERRSIASQELARAFEQIDRLSPRVREVFILRKIHGLKQKEIAEQLGISESTVEKHIASGLLKMAEFGSGGSGP